MGWFFSNHGHTGEIKYVALTQKSPGTASDTSIVVITKGCTRKLNLFRRKLHLVVAEFFMRAT